MNKQDLVAKIAKDTGATKSSAAAAVDSLLEGITRALKKGDAITSAGFVTFRTSQRGTASPQPRTGDPTRIPRRRVVRFTPARRSKRRAVGICYTFCF